MNPYYQDDFCTIYHGDCREVLQSLPLPCSDLVIADPPYNAGMRYGLHDDKMPLAEYQGWLRTQLRAWAAHTPDGLIYFPGKYNVWRAADAVEKAGLRAYRMLGWHKKEFAGDKWRGGPAMCWEPIVWATKAEKPHYNRIFGTAGRDFLVVKATHGDPDRGPHPCPKPLPVMHWLVGLFAPDGGTVLDPVMGTGRTLRAAKDLARKAIGIEIEERYCEIAAERLRQEVLWEV